MLRRPDRAYNEEDGTDSLTLERAMRWRTLLGISLSTLAMVNALNAGEPTPAERGRKALLERSYNPAVWTVDSWKNAWKHWENAGKTPPEGVADLTLARYGLHEAPYPNNGLPMGLRETPTLLLSLIHI